MDNRKLSYIQEWPGSKDLKRDLKFDCGGWLPLAESCLCLSKNILCSWRVERAQKCGCH